MKKIGVLTSGGDASGMNTAVRAVVRCAIVNGLQVCGIRRGYEGLLDRDMVPMSLSSVGGIINRGGTILRTARSERFKTDAGQQMAAEAIREEGIDGLVVIGGDGSYRGAERLIATCGVPIIGIPGTIDNDIGGTQYTIGCDTAMNVALDAIDKVRDTADSHERIFVIEVMGRSNGYIAACVGLAAGAEAILVPEVPFNLVSIFDRMKVGIARGKRSCIIVCAEGAAKAADVANFAEHYLNADVRYAVLGHIQRGGAPSTRDRIAASRFGELAVKLLLEGKSGLMTVEWNGQLDAVPLSVSWSEPKQLDETLLQLAATLSS